MARSISRPDSQQALTLLAGVVVVFFIAFALYWARAILIPLALATFFTFILSPLVTWLQKRGLGRVPSVLLVVVATVLTFGAVGLVVGQQMVELTRTLPDHADRIKAKVATMKGWVSPGEENRLTKLINDVYDLVAGTPPPPPVPGDPGTPPTVIVGTSPSWVARAQGFLTPAAEALGQAAFTFVLLLFMLLKREDLRNRVIRLLGAGRITTTTKAVDETSQRISRYLFVQFILNASFGIVVTLGLLLMGVQYAPLWGVVGFLMRYVPYIGTWIGVIPPALFTFAVSDGWALPLMVVLLFVGLEIICNNIFEPLLYGKSLGLSEVAQLVAAAFWAFLWGPIGLILSGPLTTCLLVVGKYVPQWRFLTVLLGDEPVLSPRVAFYQRLAARDQDEAAEIIEKELEKQPAEQVFDEVLVPALAAARRDVGNGRLSEEELGQITEAVREVAEEVGEFKLSANLDAPAEERVRVLLVPSKDGVDLAAADLFGRLLDPSVWEATVTPAATLTSELLERIETEKPAVVILASLPPGGLTHARYLVKRIRQQFPDVKLAVCRWGASDDGEPDPAAEQLRRAGADEVTTRLEATRTFLNGWRSVFASAASPARDGAPKKKSGGKTIGTSRA
jgi:predicted PurR-regulated permease PerM